MSQLLKELNFTYSEIQNEVFFENADAKYKIYPKGRRTGLTRGAEQAFIEWAAIDKISPMLWVDTVNGNIDRYFERYFHPDLKKLPQEIKYTWNQQKKLLVINDCIIDFRSADSPENIEGFGYKKIFLNEAGIILKNEDLYTLTILPMMIDFADSQLIAAGVPKGKFTKDGRKHVFYKLYERAVKGSKGFVCNTFSSYENPFLKEEDIKELELEMSSFSESGVEQEIYGKFIEFSADNAFSHQYDAKKHESTDAVFNASKQIIVSIDFNLNPFAVTFHHIWQDNYGFHHHQFDEAEIAQGSIPAMIDLIKAKYGRWIHAAMITGDAMGNRGDISQRDNATLYQQLIRGLGLSVTQLKVRSNPTHENSRADVNYFLANYPDFKINPKFCPNTCRDAKSVQCDAFSQILKRNRNDINQRGDFLDAGLRYPVHNFHRQWIDNHQKVIKK